MKESPHEKVCRRSYHDAQLEGCTDHCADGTQLLVLFICDCAHACTLPTANMRLDVDADRCIQQVPAERDERSKCHAQVSEIPERDKFGDYFLVCHV